MACEQPDSGSNHPRNLFVWRSNLLGSSGKGHEYMQKYLLGTESGIQGEELGASDGIKPEEVEWQTAAIEGKLDLLVTLDFRMSSTCLFSDIVLPTATWYEKDDMNTSDMHPFIHPLSAAVDPASGITQRLGNLQRYCQSIFASVCGSSWQRNRRGIATTAARLSGRALTAV